MSIEEKDASFMKEALRLAQEAAARGEVPVGAVLVRENQIIASHSNSVEADPSVTSHAELGVLRIGAEKCQNWRLSDCTLYVTLEPCIMCASAIRLSRVSRLVYGAPDLRLGGFGSYVDISKDTVFGPPPEIVSGVMQEESAYLLREFFRERRGGS
jgi:tRNA(adenine34) deaminase